VLETIFRETWGALVIETQRIEQADVTLREQLRRFARTYLGSWLATPDAIRVLVREIARSPDVGERVDEIRTVFLGLTRMIDAAKERGEVRADCNPVLAAWVVYGSLEEILTGWVLGQLPGAEQDVERAVSTVVDVTHAGLAA
jgi:TetR/AcrR family transcriptional regulator, fatty acid metabolism regulator protein